MVAVLMIVGYQTTPEYQEKKEYIVQVADEHYNMFLEKYHNPEKIYVLGPSDTILCTKPGYIDEPTSGNIQSAINQHFPGENRIVIYIDDFSQIIDVMGPPPNVFNFKDGADNYSIPFTTFQALISQYPIEAIIVRGNRSGSAVNNLVLGKTYCSMNQNEMYDYDQYSHAVWLLDPNKNYHDAHLAEKSRLTTQNPVVQHPVP